MADKFCNFDYGMSFETGKLFNLLLFKSEVNNAENGRFWNKQKNRKF